MLAEAGPIDILVNNVGGRDLDVAIEETDLGTWQKFVDLNLTHCFICTKMIGGAMLSAGRAASSTSPRSAASIANRGIGGRHYETTKAAVIHFTRATAADWAPRGVTVNAICPGLFMTEPNVAWAENHPEVIETFVAPSRWAAPASRKKSGRWRSILLRPPRATSPAPPSSSMAATRCGNDRSSPNGRDSVKGDGSQSTQPIHVHPRPQPFEFRACRDDVGVAILQSTANRAFATVASGAG